MSASYKSVEDNVYKYLTKRFRTGWSVREVGEYYKNLNGSEWHAEQALLTEFFGYPVSVPHFDTFSLKALATSIFKDIEFESNREAEKELKAAKQEDLTGFVKESVDPNYQGITLGGKPFVLKNTDGSAALEELITCTESSNVRYFYD